MSDKERKAFQAGYEEAEADAKICDVPPPGWRCTRTAGHEGPCAAVEAPEDVDLVAKGMERLRELAPARAEPTDAVLIRLWTRMSDDPYRHEILRYARAVLALRSSAIPEDYVLVPTKMTPEMERAWFDAVAAEYERPMAAGYRAMLAAVPAHGITEAAAQKGKT